MRPGTRAWGVGVLAFALVLTLAFAPAASAKLIIGGKRDNKLVGTGKRDAIFGRGGRDVLIGFYGWDRLYGEEDSDILVGGWGNDLLWGHGLDDTLDGGRGYDELRPGFGRDVVDAGPGNDFVWAGENDGDLDYIDCGAGFDRVVMIRRDRAFNCESVRALRGRRPPGRIWVDRLGDDWWDDDAGQFRDVLIGLSGNDAPLNGHAGADLILGNDGNDKLDGDLSPDSVHGGPGNDFIWGGSGHDRLWGGSGLDTIYGDRERPNTSDGRDEIISIEDDRVSDRIDCGPRWDRVVARPNDRVADDCERVIWIAR
jgi:Ca2+-binding RTX toxin-like protein